jgi:hypothetical protein
MLNYFMFILKFTTQPVIKGTNRPSVIFSTPTMSFPKIVVFLLRHAMGWLPGNNKVVTR